MDIARHVIGCGFIEETRVENSALDNIASNIRQALSGGGARGAAVHGHRQLRAALPGVPEGPHGVGRCSFTLSLLSVNQ